MFNSIQFNFIYIEPNQSNSCFKTKKEKTLQSDGPLDGPVLWRLWEGNNPFKHKERPAEPDFLTGKTWTRGENYSRFCKFTTLPESILLKNSFLLFQNMSRAVIL